MPTSLGALCTDFYVNSKLTVKMDLPADRETVLGLFERVRKDIPSMKRFKRFEDELALESAPRRDAPERWLAIQRNSLRIGVVNADSMDDAYALHLLALELAPFYLSVNALDVAGLEVVFGFDLEAAGNHHAIVRDALLAGSPLAQLTEGEGFSPIDIQPIIGAAISRRGDRQVFFEVKARSGPRKAARDEREEREDPISAYLTIRKVGPLEDVTELPALFRSLADDAERLAETRVASLILAPLRESISSHRH